MSKISIAMTTYNGEKYLLEQLTSIMNQTRNPDEVIICDDCSKDETAELVTKFIADNQLKTWKFIVNENNLGFIKNFRRAMSLTTGDIIFLADQDDVWHNTKIEDMSEIMEQNSNVLSLSCGFKLIDSGGEKISSKNKLFKSNNNLISQVIKDGEVKQINKKILISNISPGCTSVYAKKIVEQYCNNYNNNNLPHDYALNIIAYDKNGLFFINKDLISYRIHGGNTIGMESERPGSCNERKNNLIEFNQLLLEKMSLVDSEDARKYLEKVYNFTAFRAHTLNNKSILNWILGVVKYFRLIVNGMSFTYANDLVYMVKEKSISK